MLADVRGRDAGSRTMSLRRSSSLGALSKGFTARSADLLGLPHITESVKASLAAVCLQQPLLSTWAANRSVERMGSSGAQQLESSSGVIYTEAGVSRVCLMEVEAVNTADVGLQVIRSNRHGRL